MSEMRCAEFERELDELLAGEPTAAERDERLRRLLGHAVSCAACGKASQLLELLELPPGERDIVEDPGEAYWSTFNVRLRERIASEGGIPTRGRPPWVRWSGVAAAIVLGLGALWLLATVGRPEPSTLTAEPLRTEPRDADETPPLPDELAEILAATPPDAALGQVELMTGFADDGWTDGGEGWAFEVPEAEELAPEARRQLLEWLREQTAKQPGVRS